MNNIFCTRLAALVSLAFFSIACPLYAQLSDDSVLKYELIQQQQKMLASQIQDSNRISRPSQTLTTGKQATLPSSNTVASPDGPITNLSRIERFMNPSQKPTEGWALQFGYGIFNQYVDVLSPFGTNPPIGPDYILGSGDTLSIKTWGKVEESLELTLDQSGKIYIPRIGYIALSGLPLGKASDIIQRELQKLYVNFQISVNVSRLRSIKVFVLGDIQKPGAYDMPSLSTVFTALYQAGGPTKMGSLRRLLLKRGSRTVQVIDLYAYLLRGDRAQDLRLQSNDVIFIPPIGKTIKVTGAVKRPAIFEVSDEANLYEALFTYSGGLSPSSYLKRIQVERVENGDRRIVLDLNYQDPQEFARKARQSPLQNGDQVVVIDVLEKLRNTVSISGHINRSGNFQLKQGMTLRDLLNQAEGVKAKAYSNRVEIRRYVSPEQSELILTSLDQASNVKLKEWDSVYIYPESMVVGLPEIYLSRGTKYMPTLTDSTTSEFSTIKLFKNSRIQDVLFQAKLTSEPDVDYIEVFRSNPDRVFKLDFKTLLSNPDSTQNIVLEHRDRVLVRYLPNTNLVKVELRGEFKYPGSFYIRKGETFNQVIERAGGLTDRAFPFGAVFQRTSTQLLESAQQDRVLEQERKRLLFDPKFAPASANILQGLRDRLKADSGRIVVNLSDGGTFQDSQAHLVPENGDVLYVPSQPIAISLIGGVQQNIAITYIPNQDPMFYINNAGGFTDYAERNSIYVIKANGFIEKNPAIISRGDTIYIPEKVKTYIDWVDLIAKTAQILFNVVAAYKLVH